MRARLRKIFTWILFSVIIAIAIAVGGQWFIQVGEDKGLYEHAGQRWDGIMTAIFAFMTSAWVLMPLLFLAGSVAGMWLDYFLKRSDRVTGLSVEAVEALIVERLEKTALSSVSGLTIEQIENMLMSRIGEMQRETVGETFKASDERLSAMVQHFEKRGSVLEAAVKDAKGYAQVYCETLSHLISELRKEVEADGSRVTDARNTQDTFQENMERWVGSIRDTFDRQISNIDQGFLSILDRERLLDLAKCIEALGDELSNPTEGQRVDDWDAWMKGCKVWRNYVNNWASIAGEHRDGVEARVFALQDDDYRGPWKATDDLFPNALAVQDYKTFRIISRNFHAERKSVDNCAVRDAFVRPSMKGRPYVAPRDADQLPQ